MIMDLPRAVEADPDREPFGRQEAAPLLVEERAVGLQAVDDRSAGRAAPALDRDDLPIIIEAEDDRLAAVPGEADDLVRRGADMLGGIGIEGGVGTGGRP